MIRITSQILQNVVTIGNFPTETGGGTLTNSSYLLKNFSLFLESDKRMVVYAEKQKDDITKTWSWCFFLLGDGKITKLKRRYARSSDCGIDNFKSGVNLDEYNKLSAEEKAQFSNVTINNPINLAETQAENTEFTINQYMNHFFNISGNSYSPDFPSGNLYLNKNLSIDIDRKNFTNPYFGNCVEMYRENDSNNRRFVGDRNNNFFTMLDLYKNNINSYYQIQDCLYKWDKPWEKTVIGNFSTIYELTNYKSYIESAIGNCLELSTVSGGYSTGITDSGFRRVTNGAPYTNDYDYKIMDKNYQWNPYNTNSQLCHNPVEEITECPLVDSNGYKFVGCGNLYFDNIYVTTNYYQACDYIKNGTIPKDGYYKGVDSDGKPTDDIPPTENEGGEDGSHYDKTPTNNPTIGALSSGSVNYYYLEKTQLQNFFTWFWTNSGSFSDIVDNYFTGIYDNLSEMITGVYYFPCLSNLLFSSMGSDTIQIGRYDSGIQVPTISGLPKNSTIGSYKIPTKFNSFLDYDGYTKVQIYLPYCGIIDLPTNTVMGKNVSVECSVDITSCTMSYVVLADGTIIFETSTPFGIQIPITLSSGMEKSANTFSAVVNLSSQIASTAMLSTINPVMGVMNVGNMISSFHSETPEITCKGNTSSFSGQWQPQQCAIILQRPIMSKPSTYGKNVGNVVNKSYTLASLDGFTICENPSITFSNGYPTKNEVFEIYSLLESGVIL